MSILWSVLLLLATFYGISETILPVSLPPVTSTLSNDDPEAGMTTPQMIAYFGYDVEIHHVLTQDGYILEVHRIPRGRNEVAAGRRTPVMVQHCLLCSSADIVQNFPDQSLGFMLADAGYDVWLTNSRGNTYSRKHTIFNPDTDKEFWRFTLDQMAEFDIPAQIDYILNNTDYKQLYYIGHSMGTTLAFAMLSTKPEYNGIIKTMFALGPVTAVTNGRSPVYYVSKIADEIEFAASRSTTGEFLRSNTIYKYFGKQFEDITETVIIGIAGGDPAEWNKTRLDVYLGHTPAGTSQKTVVHYLQIRNAKKFQFYDWGRQENMKRYGQPTPPAYNVSRITTPVALFWGANDLFVDPKDVSNLAKQLPNLVGSYQVGSPLYGHLDFLWGTLATPGLYQRLISMMKKF